MKRTFSQTLMVLSIFCLWTINAAAHCEIPCGIYDDQARITMISEHITTIEKAMREIATLQNTEPLNCNQIIRWIINKEKHATEIQTIISQYFMTQRIKPDAEKYHQKLTVLHKMLRQAMKCKQTADIKNANDLRVLLEEFRGLYFERTQK